MTERKFPERVDVLICGGGPVGLLLAYCLARYGVSVCVVEQHDRSKQVRYGRAAAIMPRTLEMLDQLDLADALTQIGFVVRDQVSYKDGEKVENVTVPSAGITDTFFDYMLICRQRYTEDVILGFFEDIHYGATLMNFHVHEGAIESTIRAWGENFAVSSKYIVGADGGRSKVRELAGIPFEGERSHRHWVRIDGIVETNMPEARRGNCGIQSASHGSILWACLDHGATRVGFALPVKLWERLGAQITLEDVIGEAKEALRPFTLEFKTVDWWTVYSVGQRLAAEYRVKDCVFLAGDAAHTHSSGAAQGMNTGLHDSVNLSWKLAGYINGWLTKRVLDSYVAERRPIAQQIVNQDKIIAVATGGQIPEAYRDDPNADPNKILTETLKKNRPLNSGLGIRYPTDGLTVVESKQMLKVVPGERAPDVLIQQPGMRLPIRLLKLIKNHGMFTAIFFCGDPIKTRSLILERRRILDSSGASKTPSAICSYITIILGHNNSGSPSERLGVASFGNAFYDVDGQAHARYGIADDKGALFVLRPDGTIGLTCALQDGNAVKDYFGRFITAENDDMAEDESKESKPDVAVGEVDVVLD